MFTNASMKMSLVIGLSALVLAYSSPSVQAQAMAPTDAGEESSIEQAVEQVNDLDLQPMAELEYEEKAAAEDHGADTVSNPLYLPFVQGGTSGTDIVEISAASQWSLYSCTNVLASDLERGLWDDMPSVGANGDNNEAGLLWIVTNSSLTEKCSYSRSANNIDTDAFPHLRVRVAVNDGARFTVQAFDNSIGEFCEHVAVTYTTPANHDTSEYHTYQVALPANTEICRVQITIDDDPDIIASIRATALIDYIRIWNGNSGAIGWNESFARVN
jgi:hypothetical protein